MSNEEALSFGPKKYVAFHMMLAKWLRSFADSSQAYCYVTLGGTELYDIANIYWVDNRMAYSVLSYEEDPDRFVLANEKAKQFKEKGITISIIKEDIFNYRRSMVGPHIYYLDLLGICSRASYQIDFQAWFEKDVIQPGDLLLITSNLGRRQGWQKMLAPFQGDFTYLKVDDEEKMKGLYEVAHPLFVLARALLDAGLASELSLRPLGCVKYRDKRTLMALYGVICENGSADLWNIIRNVPYFDYESRKWGQIELD
jgi:hypothetical protein